MWINGFCCLIFLLVLPFAGSEKSLAAEKHPQRTKVDYQALRSNSNSSEIANLLIQGIKHREYKDVNSYFDYLVEKKPISRNGWRLLEDVYTAIRSRRLGLDVLNDWCETTNHPSAYICRGGEYLELAGKARGTDWGYTVSGRGDEKWIEYSSLAKSDLERAYSSNKEDPNSAARMILVSLAVKDEDIETWFQRATAADAVSIHAYLNKGLRLAPKWGGNAEKYQKFIEECYRTPPPGTVAYIVALECYYDLAGMSEDKKHFLNHPQIKPVIEDVLHRWIRDFPDSTSARVFQARICRDLGKAEEAIKNCSEALQRDPLNISALEVRSAAYFYDIDNGEKAEKDYKRIVEIEPLNDEALYHLGKVASYYKRDHKSAVEFYSQAINLNKANKFYFYHRGLAYSYLNQYGTAIEDFTHAVRIDSKFVKAYIERGKVKNFQNDCQAGLADYDTALAVNPRQGEAYYWRGNCYQMMKQFEKAEDDYLKAKRYDPRYAPSVERHLNEMKQSQK